MSPLATQLELNSLYCERGERVLMQNVNQCLEGGQGLRIAGANGSGKTTLLRMVSGLTTDFSGDIRWNGRSTRDLGALFRAQLCYLGHAPGVKSALTPIENLQWWQAMNGSSAATADGVPVGNPQQGTDLEERALAVFGLAPYSQMPCARLSAGQQRRVALARLVLSQHALWVLDEPFTAIDQDGVVVLEKMFDEHLIRGGMIVLTTHQPLRSERMLTLDLDAHRAEAGGIDEARSL